MVSCCTLFLCRKFYYYKKIHCRAAVFGSDINQIVRRLGELTSYSALPNTLAVFRRPTFEGNKGGEKGRKRKDRTPIEMMPPNQNPKYVTVFALLLRDLETLAKHIAM